MAEPDSEMEEHRYSHLMSATQKREFRETFVLFDYDGGGDVDLRELGMMLRKLGQAPSHAVPLLKALLRVRTLSPLILRSHPFCTPHSTLPSVLLSGHGLVAPRARCARCASPTLCL